jgi:lactoylglutathione lyase
MPEFNLLVLRSDDIDRLAPFYTLLGMDFSKHAHGTGPEHYAAEKSGVVFELYPATIKEPASTSIRLGFSLEAGLEKTLIPALVEKGGKVFSSWDNQAIIFDPEGRKVHLSFSLPAQVVAASGEMLSTIS